MKTLIRTIAMLASLAIFLVLCISVWLMLKWYITPITDIKTPTTFVVTPGISTKKLIHDLSEQKLIKHPYYIIWLAMFKDNLNKIKTGEYQLNPGETANGLLVNLINGKGILRKITFIEGWTFQQLLQSIHQNPYITHTLDHRSPEQIMTAIGHPGQSAEGMFYPDTYLFARTTSDVKILTIAYNLMQKKLMAAWEKRAKSLPYQTPEQALIVASMVEKEAMLNSERPQVAGVILKRLSIGMRLQIDATVIYGNGADYSKALTRTQLQTDTPYNTYTRAGLPPTPISMPSYASIQAALHPVITDAVYYVAKGDGSHIFSQNLNEHNQAVQAYRNNLKSNATLQPAGAAATENNLNVKYVQSISPELMLNYWQTLAHPNSGFCAYVY